MSSPGMGPPCAGSGVRSPISSRGMPAALSAAIACAAIRPVVSPAGEAGAATADSSHYRPVPVAELIAASIGANFTRSGISTGGWARSSSGTEQLPDHRDRLLHVGLPAGDNVRVE